MLKLQKYEVLRKVSKLFGYILFMKQQNDEVTDKEKQVRYIDIVGQLIL